MKSFVPMLIASLLVSTMAVADPTDLIGYWEGTTTRSGETLNFRLQLAEKDGQVAGTIGVPNNTRLGIPFDTIEMKRNTVLLAVSKGGLRGSLKGKVKNDTLKGTWTWTNADFETSFTATRVEDPRPFTEEEVSFTNEQDGTQLFGTVRTPKTPGPHPGIVLMHGSGDPERWWIQNYAELFAEHGVASLVFDKRGCGKSGGDWYQVGFEPLAWDGIAGVHLLQSRDGVDASRVGMWGISQAGWLMPLAASKSDDIAYILTTSGPAVSVEEEGYYDYLVRLRDAGYSAEVEAEARRILEMDFQVTVTGEGHAEMIVEAMKARKTEWWRSMTYFVEPMGTDFRGFYKLICEYKPVPIIESIDIPILWTYGEADKSVEPSISVGILNGIIEEHDKDFTIATFPEANHGIRIPAESVFPLESFAPGYVDTLLEWLDVNVLKDRS